MLNLSVNDLKQGTELSDIENQSQHTIENTSTTINNGSLGNNNEGNNNSHVNPYNISIFGTVEYFALTEPLF